MSLHWVASGIYRDSRTGHLFERPLVRGRQTTRKLAARTVTQARRRIGKAEMKRDIKPTPS